MRARASIRKQTASTGRKAPSEESKPRSGGVTRGVLRSKLFCGSQNAGQWTEPQLCASTGPLDPFFGNNRNECSSERNSKKEEAEAEAEAEAEVAVAAQAGAGHDAAKS